MPKSEKTLDFSSGYQELQKIVSDFESREIDLEKDLPQFERGLALARQLQKRLTEIENKIINIDKKFIDS